MEHGSEWHTAFAFARRLDDEFAATAEFVVDFDSDYGPLTVEEVFVGVSYEPCRRLFALLGDLAGNVATLDDDPRYLDDPEAEPEEWSIRVKRTGDVSPVADALARQIIDHAVGFAERHAEVDVLLDEHGAGDPDEMSLTVPVLLTAAGRFEEARAAIATGREGVHWRRVCRQLERYIDAGGDPLVIQRVPPRVIVGSQEPFSFGDALDDSRATREAVDAVRVQADHLSRDEQKTLLAAELGRRGIEKGPLWVEHTLDRIADPPELVDTLGALMKLGKAGLKLVRDGLPDRPRPDWLSPPAYASYRVVNASPRAGTEVVLDPGVDAYLERAYDEAPKLAGTVSLDAWIDRLQDGDGLAVHLGDERVGTIARAHVEDFAEVMRAATALDELPCLRACLALLATGYVLELDRPPR